MSVEAELVRTHRVKNLTTLTGIRAEMVSVYRQGRKGTLKTDDMTRFIYVLRQIAQVIEQLGIGEPRVSQLTDDELLTLIEQKIASLEGRQNGRPAARPETHNGKAP